MEQPEASTEETPLEKKSKKKGVPYIVFIVVIAIVLALVFVFLRNGDGAVGNENVVATVNGVVILESQVDDQIERNRVNIEAQGNDLSDPETRALIEDQVITQLVNEILLIEDARTLGISVTEEQIDEEYGNIKARFESEELFETELENNRFTEDSLRENIEKELIVQAYVAALVEQDPVEVTEEEIQALYDEVAAQNENLPSLEELTPQIENQLRNQKISTLIDTMVENLRASAAIVFVENE